MFYSLRKDIFWKTLHLPMLKEVRKRKILDQAPDMNLIHPPSKFRGKTLE